MTRPRGPHGWGTSRLGGAAACVALLALAVPSRASGTWVSAWTLPPPTETAGEARDCAAYLARMAIADSIFVNAPPAGIAVAATLAHDVVERAERVFGAESEEACDAWDLEGRALAYASTRPPERARALLDRALAWRIEHQGELYPRVANLLLVLTRINAYAADLEGARRTGLRAIALMEAQTPRDSVWLARALHNVGGLLAQQGDRELARSLMLRALEIRRIKHVPETQLANSLGNLCALHIELDEPRQAEPFCEEVYRMFDRIYGPDDVHTGDAAVNLAGVRALLGDSASALRLDRQALRIRTARYGPDYYAVGEVHASLALMYLRSGDLTISLAEFRAALHVFDQALVPGHEHALAALEGLGRAALACGNRELADSAFRQVIARRPSGRSDPVPEPVPDALAGLALVEAARGDRDGARTHLALADSLILRSHPPDHITRLPTLVALADVERAVGDPALALDAAVRACRLDRMHVRFTLQALPEEDILRFRDTPSPAWGALLRVADARPHDGAAIAAVWDEIIRSRALGRRELAERLHRRVAPGDSVGAALEVAFRRAARRADRLVSGPGASDADSLRAAIAGCEQAGRALARHFAPAGGMSDTLEPGHDQVMRALAREAALIAFERVPPAEGGTEPERYVALLRPAGAKASLLVHLAPVAAVDSALVRWRAAVEASAGSAAAAGSARRWGRWLARTLWQPVSAAAGRAERMYVVADGELQTIQPLAWPAAQGGELVDRMPVVQLLSAETDLVDPGRSETRRGTLLVIGGVDYGRRDAASRAAAPTHSPAERAAALGFDPLPGSAAEALVVEQVWRRAGGDVERLSGSGASADAFTRLAPTASALHLASHAWAFTGARGDETDPGPLRRVGLAFAGANESSGGGILTGAEIAALDLSKVRVVVLSTCRSALGVPVNGEGLLGLRSAFLTAGASVVVSSLWNVSDETSAYWMARFYDALRAPGADVARAARDASRATRDHLRASAGADTPYGWGAFVVCGAGR